MGNVEFGRGSPRFLRRALSVAAQGIVRARDHHVTSLVVHMGEDVYILVGAHGVLKKKKVPFDTGRKQFYHRAAQRAGGVQCREHSVFCIVAVLQTLEPFVSVCLCLSLIGSLPVSENMSVRPMLDTVPPPWQPLNHI